MKINIYLLNTNNIFRFGILKNGSKDVKGHEWFKTVDWDAVLTQKIKPAYKPKIKGEEDTSNFDYYDEEPFRTSPVEEYVDEFANFSVK